jgi:hypothetical protein
VQGGEGWQLPCFASMPVYTQWFNAGKHAPAWKKRRVCERSPGNYLVVELKQHLARFSFRQLPLDVLVLILWEVMDSRSILHLALTERCVAQLLRRPDLRERLMQRHCSLLVQQADYCQGYVFLGHHVRLVSMLPSGVWHGPARVYTTLGRPVEHHSYREGKLVRSRFFAADGEYVWRQAFIRKNGSSPEESVELTYWKPEVADLRSKIEAAATEEAEYNKDDSSDSSEQDEGYNQRFGPYPLPIAGYDAEWGTRMDRRWQCVCDVAGPLRGWRIWREGKLMEEVRQFGHGEERETGESFFLCNHPGYRPRAPPAELRPQLEQPSPPYGLVPGGALVRRAWCAELEADHLRRQEAQELATTQELGATQRWKKRKGAGGPQEVQLEHERNWRACMRATWQLHVEPKLPEEITLPPFG